MFNKLYWLILTNGSGFNWYYLLLQFHWKSWSLWLLAQFPLSWISSYRARWRWLSNLTFFTSFGCMICTHKCFFCSFFKNQQNEQTHVLGPGFDMTDLVSHLNQSFHNLCSYLGKFLCSLELLSAFTLMLISCLNDNRSDHVTCWLSYNYIFIILSKGFT